MRICPRPCEYIFAFIEKNAVASIYMAKNIFKRKKGRKTIGLRIMNMSELGRIGVSVFKSTRILNIYLLRIF